MTCCLDTQHAHKGAKANFHASAIRNCNLGLAIESIETHKVVFLHLLVELLLRNLQSAQLFVMIALCQDRGRDASSDLELLLIMCCKFSRP